MVLPWGFYLSWGWPWPVFIVILVLSVVLAAVMNAMGWRVFWVVPGLVFYSGLLWEIPDGWSLLFKLVFWAVVLVAVATALLPGITHLAMAPVVMMIGLITWCLLIAFVHWGVESSKSEVSQHRQNSTTSSSTPTPSATPTSTATPVACDYGTATFTENKSYRMLVNGLDRNSVKKAKAQVLELARSNPVFVSGFAMERRLNGGVYIDARELTSNGCWTEGGHELSTKVQGIIEASKASYGQVSSNATNTGGKNGQLVVEQGVDGDRSALVLTHEDGMTTKILLRCSNVTFEESPPKGTPHGPTDNPKPPKHKRHLQPKSSNPADYKVEPGAPKATSEGSAKPASPVKTESTGGRGVQDNPTKAPGSESGVQAPGAGPAPSSAPPSPEAGANDPSGGGTTCVPAPGMSSC